MIVHLTPLPAGASFLQLRQAAFARFPTLIDCNIVTANGVDNLAIYLPDGNTTDPSSWKASVAAYTPTHPTPEEQAATQQTNADGRAASFDQVRVKARQVLAGNGTFTAAQQQAILAALVLDRLND